MLFSYRRLRRTGTITGPFLHEGTADASDDAPYSYAPPSPATAASSWNVDGEGGHCVGAPFDARIDGGLRKGNAVAQASLFLTQIPLAKKPGAAGTAIGRQSAEMQRHQPVNGAGVGGEPAGASAHSHRAGAGGASRQQYQRQANNKRRRDEGTAAAVAELWGEEDLEGGDDDDAPLILRRSAVMAAAAAAASPVVAVSRRFTGPGERGTGPAATAATRKQRTLPLARLLGIE